MICNVAMYCDIIVIDILLLRNLDSNVNTTYIKNLNNLPTTICNVAPFFLSDSWMTAKPFARIDFDYYFCSYI